MAIKVKLVKSMSGHTQRHRDTLRGLGLTTLGTERILPDTPATRGMVNQVSYLLEVSETSEPFKPFGKRSKQKATKA